MITFNFESLKFEGITVLRVIFWEKCFPDVNVIDVLTRKMPAWIDANPRKAKKKNWARFIVNWLSREQEKLTRRVPK